MAPSSNRVRLTDIRTEIAGILELTAGAEFEAFAASWAMKRAVQHALLIIAEAAKHLPEAAKHKHLPEAAKQKHPQVSWRKIHGLGNLLRHEYMRIDEAILWSIVKEQLSVLDKAAEAMLEQPNDE